MAFEKHFFIIFSNMYVSNYVKCVCVVGGCGMSLNCKVAK